jgi:hypothetical protein
LQRELAAYVECRRLREMVTGFDDYQRSLARIYQRSLARIGSDDHTSWVQNRIQRQCAAIPAMRLRLVHRFHEIAHIVVVPQ